MNWVAFLRYWKRGYNNWERKQSILPKKILSSVPLRVPFLNIRAKRIDTLIRQCKIHIVQQMVKATFQDKDR